MIYRPRYALGGNDFFGVMSDLSLLLLVSWRLLLSAERILFMNVGLRSFLGVSVLPWGNIGETVDESRQSF
jgi:hypothetical protein